MMPLPAGITSTFLNALLGPVDEVEAVFVAAVLDRAVLLERLRVEAAALDGQRVVDDQLHRHDRVDLRRVAALVGDGVTQAGEVDQRGLAEDVVADHARREPREVEVALALDELLQGVGRGWPDRSGARGSRPARARCTAACPRRPGAIASTAARASK